jgi:hypothetical protein
VVDHIFAEGPAPRRQHSAFMLDNRYLMVYAGEGPDHKILSDEWIL